MGKKGTSKGGGKGGGKASASAPPRCSCDHPYQCSCGNRPDRPSRGHRWDPAEQRWGGKGHRQKGASTQAATVGSEATTTSVGRTTVAQWQRMPHQLLEEFCSREGRPRPKYKNVGKGRGGGGGEYRYRVIVQDAKASRRGGDHDVILVPNGGCENEEQAREEAALLALLALTPSLPHERRLPEPYRTTWTSAISSRRDGGGDGGGGKGGKAAASAAGAGGRKDPPARGGGDGDRKPAAAGSDGGGPASAAEKGPVAPGGAASTAGTASSTKSSGGGRASAASASLNLAASVPHATPAERRRERERKRRERNARIARHEAIRSANRDHPVFMSAGVRKRIERLLRGEFSDGGMSFADFDEEEETTADEDEDEVRGYVVRRLVHEGFGPSQARAACAQLSSDPTYRPNSDDPDATFDDAYERSLQWLCVHLDEEDLPEGFDPRGRTLDVVVSKGRNARAAGASSDATTGGTPPSGGGTPPSSSAASGEAREVVDAYGVTAEEAALILRSAEGRGVEVKDVLWEAICGAAGSAHLVDDAAAAPPGTGQSQSRSDVASEEMEALGAIFPPEELSVSEDGGATTTVAIALPPPEGDVESRSRLVVRLHEGRNPDVRPRVLVRGGWGKNAGRTAGGAGVGTAVQVEMARFLGELPKGEPMIYELYGHAQALLQSGDGGGAGGGTASLLPHLDGGEERRRRQQKPPRDATRNGGGGVESAKDKGRAGSTGKKGKADGVGGVAAGPPPPPRRRPRERSRFWSRRPDRTPPAAPFPTVPPSMESQRRSLPAHKSRDEFLSLMRRAEGRDGGRVLLVTGETGCGKTTQIPQFILEESPRDVKIVVSQPRRLAATGVASRVADERGEGSPGRGAVGYIVRGDVALSDSARLVFCTTGVLLRQLQSEGALDCVTHVVVDEVHERSLDADVLLGVLKEVLPAYPRLRVVLMSATMDADRFASYWGNDTPRMHIPGFTYPVEDYTLEDVLEVTGYVPPKKGKKKKWNRGGGGGGGGRRKQSPWADSERSDDEGGDGDDGDGDEDPAEEETSAATAGGGSGGPKNAGRHHHGIPLEELVKRVDESDIDYDMLGTLVRHVLRTRDTADGGSVLVFLPGAPEISKAEDAVKRICRAAESSILVLPLHGGLQPRDQQLVFRRPPKGTAKVILSTNVAETSITIPDCTVVIDTCREKQSSYDPSNRMPLLVERFASRDSLRQRRGRAGRVRAGRCYKLISLKTHDGLPAHGTPEIRRCALDQTLLSLMFLGVEGGDGTFLGRLLDPPSRESVDAAVYSLEKLGALAVGDGPGGDRRISLTPLGMHLAGIPAPPCVGKMLIMGSLLGCRSAALAMAAGMSAGRSPFMRVDVFRNQGRGKRRDDEEEEESTEEKRQRGVMREREALFKSVGNSDLAMLAAAYLKWDGIGGGGGGGGRKRFCESLGLSFNRMRDMRQLVRQLDSSLDAVGYPSSREAEKNSDSWRIIRTCAVSALSPGRLVRIERPGAKYAETVEGAVEKDGVARELEFYTRGDESSDPGASLNRRYHGVAEERVFVHPSSANFAVGNYSCPWLVYHELVRTSKAFLRDATECSSYALLLFGGKLDVRASEELVLVDGYARLSANARIGALVGGLRRRVDDLLSRKVSDPSLDIAGSVEMRIIVSLLKSDGLGQ